MQIPLSTIGLLQRQDIEASSGIVLYDEFFRICEVVKQVGVLDNRRDRSPERMQALFGRSTEDYNYHTIVQVSGCPLKCPPCYVDNKAVDVEVDAYKLVPKWCNFMCTFWEQYGLFTNVLHIMGGCPGRYPEFWLEVRENLDNFGFEEMVLFSDVVLLEHYFYDKKPWKFVDIPRFLLTGSLKGLDRETFLQNSGQDLYNKALEELKYYVDFPNFYLTVLPMYDGQFTELMYQDLYKIIPPDKVDTLRMVKYKASFSEGG